jgi:asparagine synthase (glutamine-hydrolysing)
MRTLLERLAYRGPDGVGTWGSSNVLLGHRRLSIVDLSEAGAQPLHDCDSGLHITFNGEIYNYLDVRRDLQARGYQLRTNTDTEVILGAYRCFGRDFLHHLRGMFAFVLYDDRANKVLLCRDRLGKKPLYYSLEDGRLVAASELKCFHAFPSLPLTIDLESVEAFFALQYIPGPYTVYRQVRRVMPGYCLELDIGSWQLSERRYWSVQEHLTPDKSARVSPELLDNALADSVRYRLIADVEVGLLLSGGIDSSLLACYASEQSAVPLRAFVVSFDLPDLDESRHAKAVAEALGVTLIQAGGDTVSEEMFEQVIFHSDEPLGDPACLPTFLIAKVLSQHVKVVMSGEGADELFWGYPHYRRERIYRWVAPLARVLPLRLARGLLGLLESHARTPPLLSRLQKVLASSQGLGSSRWTTVFGGDALGHLMTMPRRESGHPRYVEQLETSFAGLARARDPFTASVSLDLAYWLPDDLLAKVDRMTMAHSVEARAPFLDHVLVELALGAEPSQKADLFSTKKVLRQLLARRLPAGSVREIAYRKKHGFEAPVGRWLRQDLRPLAEERFATSALQRVDFLDARYVHELWKGFRDHGAPRSFARRIWLLLCFLSWFAQHEKRFGFSAAHE